jgi:hypothetical protein
VVQRVQRAYGVDYGDVLELLKAHSGKTAKKLETDGDNDVSIL